MDKGWSIHMTEPVKDWLYQTQKKSRMVDAKDRETFLFVFKVFEEGGPNNARGKLPRDRTKRLFDGIWEIRVAQYRIAYFWDGSRCVLLHGIRKKRDKWTSQEKEVVKKRKSTYLELSKISYNT